jgi:hypothetical protein
MYPRRAKHQPIPAEKDDSTWSNQLLERPASGEPSTFPNAVFNIQILGHIETDVDILQICIAGRWLLIPAVHRVDGFGELNATTLVNTTGVDPDIIYWLIATLRTGELNLLGSMLFLPVRSVDIDESNLIFAPLDDANVSFSVPYIRREIISYAMRENGIFWYPRSKVFLQLHSCYVE